MMDKNTAEYIFNDIMMTHIISDKLKLEKLTKRVHKLSGGVALVAFVTAVYISALVAKAVEQDARINKLTEIVKELKSAKGE